MKSTRVSFGYGYLGISWCGWRQDDEEAADCGCVPLLLDGCVVTKRQDGFGSGKDFVKTCENSGDISKEAPLRFAVYRNVCIGYIRGFSEGVNLGNVDLGTRKGIKDSASFCKPESRTRDKVLDEFLRYIKNNPKLADFRLDFLVLYYMKQTYPCPVKSSPQP